MYSVIHFTESGVGATRRRGTPPTSRRRGCDEHRTASILYEPLERRAYLSGVSFEQETYPIAGYPVYTEVADLNGDGAADIAALAVDLPYPGGPPVLAVLLNKNDGQGTFEPPVYSMLGYGGINWMASADFNGDGNLDLVSNDSWTNQVRVHIGNGDGTFQNPVGVATGAFPGAMETADFNADGRADVAVANHLGGNVSILLGNGDGTFQPHQEFGSTPAASSMAVTDLDANGTMDVVTGNVGGSVSILLGNGDGTFTQMPDLASGSGTASVVAADFNADGKKDLATMDQGTHTFSIMIGNGDGTFLPTTQLPSGGDTPTSLAAADFDGNGTIDLLGVHAYSNYVVVLLGDGAGGFAAPYVVPGIDVGGQRIEAGDFNGDGKPDVAMSDFGRTSVSVLLNTSAAPLVADAGGPYALNEGGTIALTGSATGGTGGTLIYEWDMDDNGTYETAGQVPSFSAAALDGPAVRAVTVRVTDSAGTTGTDTASVMINNVTPAVGTIVAPADPRLVNTSVATSATFADPGVLDTHTASWDWGDGTSSPGTVTEAGGSGSAQGSHVYTAAGVYTVTLTVTDDDGDIGQSLFRYVVVYNPAGGFVTGGGWIDSPAGAYTPDPTAAGRATFGFVSQYQKGASAPSGNTTFHFAAGDLIFKSTSYDWMVTNNGRAQYKGTGSVNGVGGYKFMVTVVDGEVRGEPDTLRIRIWDTASNSTVYDNLLGALDDTEPTTVLGGGNIVIHK